MYIKIILSVCLCYAFGEQQIKVNTFKDQYCTDPRTMKKHAAYTEWADAYSCTRHRCQPGGRNLAIYTVGCKRVEAPESAIECEEVVEDTNIQFPYCCTRLRCLVVVRGEVWTRVLGQPWETLPAAPWSHMYKMKKPPPGDSGFVPKSNGEGPIFELASDVAARETRTGSDTKNLVSTYHPQDSAVTEDCEKATQGAGPSPDIVIALTTNKDKENKGGDIPNPKASEHKPYPFDDGNDELEKIESEVEDPINVPSKQQTVSWTEIPQNQWKDEGPAAMESHEVDQKKPDEKPPGFNLQSLVDAIGTRMRDIEDVVQKMSDKVHQGKKKVKQDEDSAEKRSIEVNYKENNDKPLKAKSANPETENYKRFPTRPHSNKYRSNDISTEKSLYVEDNNNPSGYYSDTSNNLMRRSPKEPSQPTYMVPVEPQRRNMLLGATEVVDNLEQKKKRKHKRKKTKSSKGHKKTRRKDTKVKKGKKGSNSMEIDAANIVSLEDSALMSS